MVTDTDANKIGLLFIIICIISKTILPWMKSFLVVSGENLTLRLEMEKMIERALVVR
jgi:hypothetical protein